MSWIVYRKSKKGPISVYGPFADKESALGWAIPREEEEDEPARWLVLPLRSPGR